MFDLPANASITNVAVAIDFSSCSQHAIEHGLAIARHFGATLHFLHILRPSKFSFTPEMIPAMADAMDRDCDQLLRRLTRSRQLEGIRCCRWIEQGEISAVAGDFVRRHHIDLLVLGTHGRGGLPHLLLGSVAQQILHSVRCPCLTVGPRAPGAGSHLQLRRMLLSTDLSPESLAALPYVLTTVREWHPQLDVVHVCPSGNPAHRQAVEQLQSGLRAGLNRGLVAAEYGASPHCELLKGNPAAAVLDFAGRHHEDLIVLGLQPHRALYDGPFWSHAYEIVCQAQCPVLSVRAAHA
jgi:nucleotide-binding universal stress UspA family protein